MGEAKTNIVASGGGVRKNEVLKKLIGERFQASVSINTMNEETATGAALFSGLAVGRVSYDYGFTDYINYV